MYFYNQITVLFYLVVYQFRLIFPYWIAGVAAGSLLSVFAAARIKSMVPGMGSERYSIGAALFAALLGAASPICMYGTIPVIVSLGRKGVPQYILVTFMVSSILLNPSLFILSFALGTPIALVRLAVCITAGLAAGMLVKAFFKGKGIFNFNGFEEKGKSNGKPPTFRMFLRDLNKAITITAPYFLAGIALTALFDRYFPREWIVALFGSNKGLGVLLAASLGVPVYLCGGGTVPLIGAWLRAGMSPGSAVAFMVSGPATKLTNLGGVKIILGAKNFVLYIVFNIMFAIISGLVTDFIYGFIK